MIRVQKKRRSQGKTDYKARRNLLKSDFSRICIRKTNKYIIMQLVESNEAKDKVLVGVTSKILLNHGIDKKFVGSLKSIPAAYLTGLLMSKKLKENQAKLKDDEFILDIGLARNIKGNRIYAGAKGIVDGGIKLKINKEVFPSDDVLKGKNSRDELKPLIEKITGELK